MRKNRLIYKKARIAALLLLLTSGLIGLNGCSTKEVIATKPETGSTGMETQTEASEGLPGSTTSENQSVKEDQTDGEKPSSEQSLEPVKESGENTLSSGQGETDTVKAPELTGLLGLTKDELQQEIMEEPSIVDEGGLEFKNYGIRAWFDTDSKVSQIYLLNKEIELNGVKTGDKIAEFKKAFGEPIKDEYGDAHFKYKNYYLSVGYDTKTQETFSVYLLKEDF